VAALVFLEDAKVNLRPAFGHGDDRERRRPFKETPGGIVPRITGRLAEVEGE